MPTYEYICSECGSVNDKFYSIAERPETSECACGGEARYMISAPNLMMKEAYLDGTKREGWAELREASKLNKEMIVQKDSKEKKRIAKQIRKLGVDLRRDG